jgi:hypothetical protein
MKGLKSDIPFPSPFYANKLPVGIFACWVPTIHWRATRMVTPKSTSRPQRVNWLHGCSSCGSKRWYQVQCWLSAKLPIVIFCALDTVKSDRSLPARLQDNSLEHRVHCDVVTHTTSLYGVIQKTTTVPTAVTRCYNQPPVYTVSSKRLYIPTARSDGVIIHHQSIRCHPEDYIYPLRGHMVL